MWPWTSTTAALATSRSRRSCCISLLAAGVNVSLPVSKLMFQALRLTTFLTGSEAEKVGVSAAAAAVLVAGILAATPWT